MFSASCFLSEKRFYSSGFQNIAGFASVLPLDHWKKKKKKPYCAIPCMTKEQLPSLSQVPIGQNFTKYLFFFFLRKPEFVDLLQKHKKCEAPANVISALWGKQKIPQKICSAALSRVFCNRLA